MRFIIFSALGLSLAACGSPGEESNGAAQLADAGIEMKAGNWQHTMVVEKFDLPGVPPEVKAMLQQNIGKAQTVDSCMTDEQIANGWKEQATRSVQGQACETDNYSAKNGKLTGKIVCKDERGADATMVMQGVYTADTMSLTTTADITDPSMPGEKGTMVMKMTGKRTGDCKS